MKICVVKQPYVAALTWQSHKFTSGRELLGKCFFRASNISLLIAFEGDVWVVEDSKFRSGGYDAWAQDEAAMQRFYEHSTAVSWDSVPWKDYDVVISVDAIIPDDIIKAYPGTLWCYHECEHATWSFVQSKQAPIGAYDLFHDYTLESPLELGGLPQAISFPHIVRADILCDIIRPTNEPSVFLSGRMVRPHTSGPNLFATPPATHVIDRYQKQTGLPIKYPSVWDYGKTAAMIALSLITPAAAFLRQLGSCKYLLHVPAHPRDVGQILIEAAALGLIVISSGHEAYSLICHPFCWVSPGDVEGALLKIEFIEKSQYLQVAILAYQKQWLQYHFWDQPISLLRRACTMKGACRWPRY